MPVEKKVNAKSVRMTNRVLAYVEAQQGEGFNAKFEAMVLYCMENEKHLKEESKELERQIAQLAERRNKLASLIDGVERMRWQLDTVMKAAEALADKCDSKGAAAAGAQGKD